MKAHGFVCGTLIALLFTVNGLAQSTWQYTRQDDPLQAKMRDAFALEGKYLTPPRLDVAGSNPSLVVVCVDRKVKENYFAVGAVVNTRPGALFPVMMDARLDGKSISIGGDQLSTDGTGVYFGRADLVKVLKGHLLIVSADEYLGPQIVTQFATPDPSEILAACSADRMLLYGMKH
jgi:hypothetical protein